MKRLFTSFGVDYVQWRALVRAYLWMDYAALTGAYGRTEARGAIIQLTVFVTFLTGVGFTLALIVWGARDPFFAASLVVSSIMFWTGVLVLSQPGSLAAPDDYDLVAAHPVTSRTYFAVRLSAMIVLVLETTALVGWLPIVAFLTRAGGSMALAGAAALAILAGALTATTGIVAVYGWLIRHIPAARLSRMLAQAGAVLGLLASAAFAVAVHHMIDSERPFAFVTTVMPRDLRTFWFPGVWFASYVAVADGTAGKLELIASALSGLMLGTFASALSGRMSLDYAGRVAELGALSTPAIRPLRERLLFRRGEARAVAVLIASHLRGDTKFQLAIASNIMMGAVMTFATGGFRLAVDPFAATGPTRMQGMVMPVIALAIIPMHVYQTISTSSAYQASWLFFSTPCDISRMIRAARDATAAYVLLPVVLALGLFYLYAYAHVGHALLQTVLLGALAYVILQGVVLAVPRVPFATPAVGERRSFGSSFPLGVMLVVMIVAMPFAVVVQWVAFLNLTSTVAVLAALGVLMWIIDDMTRRRIERRHFTTANE
jgi:hypothetical protein